MTKTMTNHADQLDSAGTAARLFDAIIERGLAKNDAEISRDIRVAPPVISKLRNHGIALGSKNILRIHEVYGLPADEIRRLSGAVADVLSKCHGRTNRDAARNSRASATAQNKANANANIGTAGNSLLHTISH